MPRRRILEVFDVESRVDVLWVEGHSKEFDLPLGTKFTVELDERPAGQVALHGKTRHDLSPAQPFEAVVRAGFAWDRDALQEGRYALRWDDESAAPLTPPPAGSG